MRLAGTRHLEGAWHYAYRADGMRVRKSLESNLPDQSGNPAEIYRYDGQMPVETIEGTVGGAVNTVERHALGARGVDMIERTTGTTAQTRFPLYDAHGNSVGTLGRSGTNSWTLGDERAYDAWGRVRTGLTTGPSSARYCASLGHVQDDESGLVYMRARYYEPGTGRFVSQDSAKDGVNWFQYCRNDPINQVDQSGNSATSTWVMFLLGVLSTMAGLAVGMPAWIPIAVGLALTGYGLMSGLADARMIKKLLDENSQLKKMLEAQRIALNSAESEAAERSLASPAALAIAKHTGDLTGAIAQITIEQYMDDIIMYGIKGYY